MTTGIPSSARTRPANSEPRYVSRLDLETYQSGTGQKRQAERFFFSPVICGKERNRWNTTPATAVLGRQKKT